MNPQTHTPTHTHTHYHILDLVISHAIDQFVSSVRVKLMSIADHHTVDCEPAMSRKLMVPMCVPALDFRHFELEPFFGEDHNLENGPQ